MSWTNWSNLNTINEPDNLIPLNIFIKPESFIKISRNYTTKYLCFIDVESKSKYLQYKTCEFIPKIKELSLIIIKATKLKCAASCFKKILKHILNNESKPECLVYGVKIKTLKVVIYQNLFKKIHDQWNDITFIAHNGLSFDFKLLSPFINNNDNCSDSLLSIKMSKKLKSYKNIELFKSIQTDWSNYSILSHAHDSIYDVIMMLVWYNYYNLDPFLYSYTIDILKNQYSKNFTTNDTKMYKIKFPQCLKRKFKNDGC